MATHLTQAWIQRVEEMSREVESIATDVRKQKEELEEVPQTLSRYKNFLRGARFQASSVGLTSLQNSFAVWEGLCQVFENTPTYLECTALIHALHLGIEKCQDFLRNDLAERPEVGYVEELRQAAVVSSYNTLTFTARTCLSGVAVSPDQLALQESVELFQFCLDQLEQQFGTDEAMVSPPTVTSSCSNSRSTDTSI